MHRLSLLVAAALFLGSGFLHLVRPGPFIAIVPPYIPHPREVVFISGLAELAGGLGLLLPATRRVAGWGLALLLVAVFPANFHMATNGIQVTAKPLPASVLWGRLFLQPLLIWWILSVSRASARLKK